MKLPSADKLFSKVAKIVANYVELFKLVPPYDYVQIINEQSIHGYLQIERADVKRWVIVGGYLGNEVPTILNRYPNSEVDIFECSPKYVDALVKRYGTNSRVNVHQTAVSDKIEAIEFFETNLKGSGSILKVGDLSKKSYGMQQTESHAVQATTLDSIFSGKEIDVLQIDVQGAEMKVLGGAVNTLAKTKAVFCEVSIRPDLYEDAVTFDELNTVLKHHEFSLISLGTDLNLTGNALYLKNSTA